MPMVKEMKINGATVRFHDDAYAGASKEEIERRKRQAQAVCEQIFQNAARRGDKALKEAQ